MGVISLSQILCSSAQALEQGVFVFCQSVFGLEIFRGEKRNIPRACGFLLLLLFYFFPRLLLFAELSVRSIIRIQLLIVIHLLSVCVCVVAVIMTDRSYVSSNFK